MKINSSLIFQGRPKKVSHSVKFTADFPTRSGCQEKAEKNIGTKKWSAVKILPENEKKYSSHHLSTGLMWFWAQYIRWKRMA